MLAYRFNIFSRTSGQFTALLILCSCPTTRADEPPTLRDRFLNEAPKAWAEAEKINQDVVLQTAKTSENHTEDGSQWIDKEETVVKSRGKIIIQQIDESPMKGNLPKGSEKKKISTSRVYAINDQCSFCLRKEGTEPWKVLYVRNAADPGAKWITSMVGRALNSFSMVH